MLTSFLVPTRSYACASIRSAWRSSSFCVSLIRSFIFTGFCSYCLSHIERTHSHTSHHVCNLIRSLAFCSVQSNSCSRDVNIDSGRAVTLISPPRSLPSLHRFSLCLPSPIAMMLSVENCADTHLVSLAAGMLCMARGRELLLSNPISCFRARISAPGNS